MRKILVIGFLSAAVLLMCSCNKSKDNKAGSDAYESNSYKAVESESEAEADLKLIKEFAEDNSEKYNITNCSYIGDRLLINVVNDKDIETLSEALKESGFDVSKTDVTVQPVMVDEKSSLLCESLEKYKERFNIESVEMIQPERVNETAQINIELKNTDKLRALEEYLTLDGFGDIYIYFGDEQENFQAIDYGSDKPQTQWGLFSVLNSDNELSGLYAYCEVPEDRENGLNFTIEDESDKEAIVNEVEKLGFNGDDMCFFVLES